MEKLTFNHLKLTGIEKYREQLLEEVKNYSSVVNFLNEKKLTNLHLENNLGKIYDFIKDHQICESCKSFNHCSKKGKGLKKSLFVNEYGEVDVNSIYCQFKKQFERINQCYNRRNFEDQNILVSLLDINRNNSTKNLFLNEALKSCYNMRNKGIYVKGSLGSGKSFLLCAFSNTYLAEHNGEKKCCFANVRMLVDELRDAVINDKESFYKLLDGVKNCDLLILDDLGGEKITEWSRDEIITEILEARIRSTSLTFVSSEYSIKELTALYSVGNFSIKAKKVEERLKMLCDEMEIKGDY